MTFNLQGWKLKALGIGTVCALGGLGAGEVVSASAASKPAAKPAASAHAAGARAKAHRGGLLKRAVTGQGTIYTKDGWKTVSFVRGTLDSVSGQTLTIDEGTPAHTYKTATVTVPTGAVVRNNRAPSSLSALTAGERVAVITGPRKTAVIARTPKTP